jgi:hypothetical protein
MTPSGSLQPSDRRGVALPLALFTLVIAAVMITAVFYVGRLEQRMGYNSVASTQAFEAAEAGAAAVLTSWVPSTYNSMAPGSTISLPSTPVGGNALYTASIRRLNSSLFLVQAEGRYLVAGQAITRRQVARLVRLDPPDIDPQAALTTRLGLDVSGVLVLPEATVNGRDTVPTDWLGACPPPGLTAPAILDSAGAVTTSGPCAANACLTGNGPIQTDFVGVTTATFNQFGDENFASLSAAAEKVFVAPSNNLGSLIPSYIAGSPVTCNYSDPNNWGEPEDPTSACWDYFPLVYAPGDLTLSGGRGQGILLVEGNLLLAGNVRFYGIIVVQGKLDATDGQVIGGVMVDNEFALPASITGTTQLDFSRCVIHRAVTGAARPSVLRERSWVQLY